MKRNKLRIAIGVVLAFIGIALIAVSVFMNFVQLSKKKKALAVFNIKQASELIESNISEKHSEEKLESGIASADDETEESKDFYDTSYVLKIPKIDSREPVVEGTDKKSLSAALGHQIGTACPGEVGNCVIAGHRNYTFGKYFNRLGEVEVGDMIYIDTPAETFSYQVSEIKIVKPEDVEIMEDTDEEILTLYTCTPIYIATHRLVVIAERIA